MPKICWISTFFKTYMTINFIQNLINYIVKACWNKKLHLVIFLKYILGCNTTSKVSTKKAAFQNSLVHEAVTNRGDAVPGRKISCLILGQQWHYCNIWRTWVNEYCYRGLTLFTFLRQANEFKMLVGVWVVTRMYEKKCFSHLSGRKI